MQNAFIARLLGKPAPTPDASAPAVEEITIPKPAAVETAAIKETPTQGRNCEDFTPDAGQSPSPDSLHPESEPRAILAQTDVQPRAKLGTFAKPRTVYASRLSGCPYDCAGVLLGHGHGLFECASCATWWMIRPPDADLAAELAGDPGAVEDPQVTRPTSAATPAPPDGLCPGCLSRLTDQGRGALWCPTCRRWFEAGPGADDRADDTPPALFDSGAATGWVM